MGSVFKCSIKNAFLNKKSLVFSGLLLGLAVIIPALFISLSLSFSGQAFVEIESFSFFLRYYTANTENALYKLCAVVNILSIIIGAITVLCFALNYQLVNKKRYKNYLIMGASANQVGLISFIESFILYVVGIILGVILSYVTCIIVGAITGVTIVFNIKAIGTVILLYFAIISSVAVITPIWVNASL